jgi:hypothetical protein
LSGGGPGNGALLISGRVSSSPDGTGWYAYVLWAIALESLEFVTVRKEAGDHDVIIYLGSSVGTYKYISKSWPGYVILNSAM